MAMTRAASYHGSVEVRATPGATRRGSSRILSRMDSTDVRAAWEANADAWIRLSRSGYDIHRDLVNTPAFFRMLPDVRGQAGLDVGCGEGHNTRLVAHRGARVVAVDLSETFLKAAIEVERLEPRGIRYRVGDAEGLPLHDASFDFVTAFMSLMDTPHPERALAEAARVLKPGGFLQFSITHPCFQHLRVLRKGEPAIGDDYFEPADGVLEEWSFSAAPDEVRAAERPFRIPIFARTLSAWVNAVLAAGLAIEEMVEPRADEAAVAAHPKLAAQRRAPLFLIVRARKR
jgi:ubiquinone/menaquinone biosynthesis C-methylase UbiE